MIQNFLYEEGSFGRLSPVTGHFSAAALRRWPGRAIAVTWAAVRLADRALRADPGRRGAASSISRCIGCHIVVAALLCGGSSAIGLDSDWSASRLPRAAQMVISIAGSSANGPLRWPPQAA